MSNAILDQDHVILGAKIETKEAAIRLAGQVLVDKGFVEEEYIEMMMEREALTTTYMGNFIAIPHGTDDAKSMVKQSGISVIQLPDGVDFGSGNLVKLVIGIAGKNNEHLELLSKIAIVCSDEKNVQKLINSSTKQELLSIFEGVN
jgi:PTS system mannitol-specific IIA component